MDRRALVSAGTALALSVAAIAAAAPSRTEGVRLPAPALASPAATGLQRAVFSGGCFWGVQGVLSHVHGVRRAVSGYAGGAAATARYDEVETGRTGHAESVEVEFDPKQVSYGQLLQVFFSVALNPTEVDRQGPDVGPQYRSVVWAANPEQAREAKAYIRQLDAAHAFARPIATRVEALPAFYPAEGYHQDFYRLHPDNPYIRAWDVRKVEALRTLYPTLYVAAPARGV
jgi:peptide-methionine (S)-S-oxide reductase